MTRSKTSNYIYYIIKYINNTNECWKILNSHNKNSDCVADIGDIGDLYNFLKIFTMSIQRTLLHPAKWRHNILDIMKSLIVQLRKTKFLCLLKNLKITNHPEVIALLMINEHISNTISIFLPIYDSGIVPEKWLIGIVKPFYKNKGKIRLYDLSFDYQLDLFDKVVTPVLLHGCEIWVFENVDITERLHLVFF